MIDQDVKKFVLRRLLQANSEPQLATTLKLGIRAAFTCFFTEGDLDTYLTEMSDSNVVAFAKDELDQLLIGLTPRGKIAAQRLIRLS